MVNIHYAKTKIIIQNLSNERPQVVEEGYKEWDHHHQPSERVEWAFLVLILAPAKLFPGIRGLRELSPCGLTLIPRLPTYLPTLLHRSCLQTGLCLWTLSQKRADLAQECLTQHCVQQQGSLWPSGQFPADTEEWHLTGNSYMDLPGTLVESPMEHLMEE